VVYLEMPIDLLTVDNRRNLLYKPCGLQFEDTAWPSQNLMYLLQVLGHVQYQRMKLFCKKCKCVFKHPPPSPCVEYRPMPSGAEKGEAAEENERHK
jgi:hypothetical protein